jgi:hypothetical protein
MKALLIIPGIAVLMLASMASAAGPSASVVAGDPDALLSGLQTNVDSGHLDALSAVTRSADGSVSYSDPVGDADAGLAPDISNIVVTQTGGRIIFQIGIANLGPGLIEAKFLTVPLDTDRNPATGCSGARSPSPSSPTR